MKNSQQNVARLTEELNKEKAEHELTKNALQKSEVRLQTIINQVPVVIWEVDDKGIFTLARGELKAIGIKPDNLVGYSIFELYKDNQEVLDKINLAMVGNNVKWFGEVEGIGAETRVIPLINETGKIEGLRGVNVEIAASKITKLEPDETQQELEANFDERISAVRASNEELIDEIVRHKKAREELLYRLNFEELITTLSTHFINLAPDEIDGGIQVALEWIGTFSGVDRSYVFLLDETGKYINNNYEWCAGGIQPQIEQRKQIPIRALGEWEEQIERLETIYIPSTAKLPRERWMTKRFLRSQSIKSLIVVPMAYCGIFIGFLGFDSVREEKNWSENIIALLRIMGEMFINALERKRVEMALAESEKKYRHLVETSQSLIWSLDIEGRFTFVNQAAKHIYGYEPGEIIGRYLTDFVYEEEVEKVPPTALISIKKMPIFDDDNCSNFQWETIHKREDGKPVYLNFNGINLKDKLGNFQGVIGTAIDITERKKSEEALQRAKDQLQAVLDAVPWSVSWISSDLRYIGVNKQLAGSFNLHPEVFIGKEIGFLGSSSGFVKSINDFFAASEQQKSQEVESRVNGGVKNYLIVFQKYDGGRAVVSVGIDISERKQAEAIKTKLITSLKESERKFRSLYEATSDAVILLDEEGIFDCNRATLTMFGLSSKEDFFTKKTTDFYPEYQQNGRLSEKLLYIKIARAICKGNNRFEWVIKRVDNSEFPVEVLLTAMKVGDISEEKKSFKNRVIQAVIRDITERKRNEEQIKASLAEKEVLLKEIHHRVKNNLQVISSLLRLQSRYVNEDEGVMEILKESQNRVGSMALVHEHLYQSKDLSKIDFSEYIHNLASHIFKAYEVKARGVKLSVNVVPVFLNIDTVVPCGLIINELLSNSLKYAFPEGYLGNISIDFNYDQNDQNDQNKLILQVGDDGAGFPEGLDYKNSGSLGLRLVCSLVRQLKGEIERLNQVGTVFKIIFSSVNGNKL
ncbi:PAS domain S-box protein [Okeania sp. SIO3I5]|uniref:PAS domain S-box protein n=1 Tax=Okeania sp. SIO3I5 TaxID=2607805 RepID=UPI0025FF692A|nr:PAS domain S-box protein [Okeania sp. SIO3I5]